MGYCMRPLRKGFIIRALNLLQQRKLTKIRLSWAVSDCLGHISFNKKISADWWSKENLYLLKRVCPNKSRFNFLRVMIWECVTSKNKVILLPLNGTISSSLYCQVLQDGVMLCIDWYYPDSDNVFVQDNAPCCTSTETLEFLSEGKIRVNQRLPQNSDMNIIENLWRLMNIDLRKIINSIHSRPDLMNTLQKILREISDDKILQLYHNFLARMRAVVKFDSTVTHN